MTIRPHCFGYLFLYFLCLLSVGDTVFTAWCQVTGTDNAFVSSFGFFSYLITAAALCYASLYARSRVEIRNNTLRTVGPVMRCAREGEPRAMFLFRQGNLDNCLWDKSFQLSDLIRYGYCSDLGYPRVDESDAVEKGFMPVNEITFVLKENRRCHMNAGPYSEKQLHQLLLMIQEKTGLKPEGRLSSLLSL